MTISGSRSARRALASARNLGEEGLVGRIATEEVAHLLHLFLLAALLQDRLAIAQPDLLVEHVLLERRKHVDRDHLRPHVAVIAPGIAAAGDVAEGGGKARAFDVAKRRGGFELFPQRERR